MISEKLKLNKTNDVNAVQLMDINRMRLLQMLKIIFTSRRFFFAEIYDSKTHKFVQCIQFSEIINGANFIFFRHAFLP